MVRSLISQLSEQCIKMPLALEALYSSLDKGNRQPSLDALMNVLQQILQEFPQSYLILDALDECADRAELMRILEQMAGWQLEKMRILVTSRKERDIESSLEDVVNREYGLIKTQSYSNIHRISTTHQVINHRIYNMLRSNWYVSTL
jgi:hypothetical protein